MSAPVGMSFLVLATFAASLQAALPSPAHQDVHFVTEHVPESAQDARFLALPWPAEPSARGRWQTTWQAGYVAASASFWQLDGPTVGASARYGVNDRWGLLLIGFFDRFKVGGDRGDEVLNPRFLRAVPLDLPENARFSDPRGDVEHWGVGVLTTRRLGRTDSPSPWSLAFGVVFDRLDVQGLRADFQLLGGADTDTRGVLDHSSTANFVTPIVELQRWYPFGEHWAAIPRALAGAPLPTADYDLRLTGPGFDLSTARGDGSPGRLGDAFVGLGFGFQERHTGLEIDLGSTLYYPLYEQATHVGVEQAIQLQISWHSR